LHKLSWRNISDLINDSDETGTEKEPLTNKRKNYQQTRLGGDLPSWCHINIDELDRKRSRLAKAIFGPTPQNRQHALFFFGSNGPEFHLLCLRIMLVFSCMYTSQLVISFVPMLARSESTTTFALIVYCVFAFVPAIAFIFNKKRLIASLVQVGSIGPFVLPQAISDSEREEKTSMAVRVLVVYFKLAQMTTKFLANSSSFELDRADGHYTNHMSSEYIAELSRMYRLYFNDDGDGFLSRAEFQSLLSSVGITLANNDADELVKAIVKSAETEYVELMHTVDGVMGISTDVFLQWYANQLGDCRDKKECAAFLFKLFDDDNSGDITVLEFKQQLDKMDIGITHAEADELIQELDVDGNGVLCEDEFEELMEHFYPLEFSENWEN